MKKKFWNLKATTNNSAELVLYGAISEVSWYGDEVTPKEFADELNSLGDVQEISVRINSGGGDVFAGMAIHSMLKRHKAKVTVYIDGLAASIASIIAMAGDKIIMPKGSMMMIHNPWTSVFGADANELRNMADTLDKIRDTLLDVYMDRTGMEKETILSMVNAETWMTATDAVEKGFADEIEHNFAISASIRGEEAFFNGLKVELSNFAVKPKLPEAQEKKIANDIPTRMKMLELKLREV